jgi:hypothetical protein
LLRIIAVYENSAIANAPRLSELGEIAERSPATSVYK